MVDLVHEKAVGQHLHQPTRCRSEHAPSPFGPVVTRFEPDERYLEITLPVGRSDEQSN